MHTKSLLGANKRLSSTAANFNDYTDNGCWCAQRSSDYTNAPSTSFAGSLYVVNANDTDMTGVHQYAYNVDLGKMFYRFKWAGTWGDWKEIATDLPSFYKDYNSISDLQIGVQKLTQVVGAKANIEVAKDCFATLSTRTYGLWICQSSVSSNCFIYILKDTAVAGYIEITEVSTGNKKRYKRGYNDADFVEIT